MVLLTLFAIFACMKPAQIFHQYIWIINALRAFGQLTLEELNEKWVEDKVNEGNALPRSSFNRHRDAILDMFGIVIDCNKKTYIPMTRPLRIYKPWVGDTTFRPDKS